MSTQKKILIPLPSKDCDPTEVAVPWKILKQKGFEVQFATPKGIMAIPDQRMLTGDGLFLFKPVLMADGNGRQAFKELSEDLRFCNPLPYEKINILNFSGLILPGGHDQGMKEYLESTLLQRIVAKFFDQNLPVGAICHGVVLAARSKSANSGKSVLEGKVTTSLLKSQELLAYKLTKLWLGTYYLTYPDKTVEDEVRAAIGKNGRFESGPKPLFRDTPHSQKNGFTSVDGNYISARWPGDAHAFAHKFVDLLAEKA